MPLIDAPPLELEPRGRQQQSSGLPNVLLGTVSSLVAFASFANVIGTAELHSSWPYFVAAVNLFWLVTYIVCVQKKFGTGYLFANAFVLTLYLFHFSYVLLYLCGTDGTSFMISEPLGTWYERASWYVTLALGSLGIGIALSGRRSNQSPTVLSEIHSANTFSFGYWMGLGLLWGSVVAVVLLAASVGNVFAYSRTQIFGGIGDTRGLGYVLMVLPSAMILLVCTANTRSRKMFAYGTAAASFLLIMFLGERSAALFPGLIGLIVWRKVGKSVPTSLLLVGILSVMVLIPVVRELRTVGPYSEVKSEDVAASFKGAKIGDVFVELGAMHGLLANVLWWVPSQDPYRYGSSYLVALKELIPNVGLSRSTSERSTVEGASNSTEYARRLSPSDWYIFKVNRWMFKTGGGSGFSIVAEAYLNFGCVGVIIIFLLLGVFFGRIDQINLQENPRWLVTVAIICWPLLKIIRNDFESLVKPIGLILVTLLVWRIVSGLLGMRSIQLLKN